MKHRKLLFIVALAILQLFVSVGSSKAETEEDSEQGSTENTEDIILDRVSLDGVQHYWNELINDYGGYLPELEKTNIVEFIKNTVSFSLKNIVIGFINFLFYELILNGKLLGLLLTLTLFSTVLQTMHAAFEESAISKIANFVVYMVLIFIALNSFYLAFSYTKDAIDTMSGFMIALLPLLLGLMASFGNVLAVSFFHPVTIFLINISGVLISTFILPLLFLAALLLIVSSLNENYQVTHLAHLFKTVALATLGAFLTLFIGVMSLQGTASAIQDGIAIKTAKFITGNFIPVIGKTFTDAADTILSASLLLKNGIGIVGVIMVVFVALFPAMKILAIAFIYKIAAAILQPIGDGPIIKSLNTISHYMIYILACLLAVTIMFFFTIVIITMVSNITVFLG